MEIASTDHDLLIRLDEKVANVLDEVRLLRDGTQNEIKDLKLNKLERQEFLDYKVDHERHHSKEAKDTADAIVDLQQKTDRLVIQMAAIGGALLVLQFVIPLALKYLFHIG